MQGNLHFEQIVKASKQLKGIIKETGIIYSSFFSQEYNNNIYFKPENLQHTGSYKLRGAYNKIAQLTEKERAKGIIASSAGNHAQGVAFAASILGVNATIVMPRTTPLIKIDATKRYGANVILYGDIYDDAYQKAKSLKEKYGYIFVHPFDDYYIIAGQGTIGLEIMQELSKADIVLVPVGGGGLISGVAVACKSINPLVKIIGVEPQGANAMHLSLNKSELVTLKRVDTIADGVAVRAPGHKNFKLIKKFVDEIITVSDFDIMESFLLLLENHKLIGEPAGVLSLAALKKLKVKGKNIVSIISGGNIDVVTISSMINRGLISQGRLFCFSVDLPDKPGELHKISAILSKLNANIVKLDHNQFASIDRFKYVNLSVTIETHGHDHLEKIVEELKSNDYDILSVAN